MIRSKRWILSSLLLAIGVTPVAAEPTAPRFEGLWTCQSRSDGGSFEWRVSRDLAGGWLTGEGIEQGRRMSLDVWAFDDRDRLQKRRQFTPAGALIEIEVVERGQDRLRLEGSLNHRDGRSLRVREQIVFGAADRFDAEWEVDEGRGWRTVVDETCRKAG